MRKVFIRLDDGSLIGRAADFGRPDPSEPDKVVRLSVDQAAVLGRASDKEVARLQAILTRVRQQYPAPLKAPDKKALQRQQSARADVAGSGHGPWLHRCREVLNKVLRLLGEHKDVYYVPVNPNLLPDYYQVIKEPLFLMDIEQRINNGAYQQPQDFYNDVRHHFNNVKLYNPEDNPYRKLGAKAEDYFEQLWAGTGFSTERTKRTTAGLAAPKFDPEKFEPPAKPRPARSNQGAGSKRSRDGAARTMSHEVTSGGRHGGMPGGGMPGMGMGQGMPHNPHVDEMGRVSQQRIQEMGAFLAREDLPEEYSSHLLTMLPPAMLAGLETGELELDFEMLDNDTLLRIDAWMRTLPGAPNGGAGGMMQGGGVGMMQGGGGGMMPPGHYVSPQPQPSVRVDSFDDDEDYEEESDESD